MSTPCGAANKRKGRKPRYLVRLEKLDGHFPGLATEARMLLDQGTPGPEAAAILSSHFSIPVTPGDVRGFRERRWGPGKDKAEEDFATLECFYKKVGGNHGLDLAAFARVRELMKTSDIKEANAVRLALIKMREQDLKEQEFLLKTGQLETAEDSDGDGGEADTERMSAVDRIKAIFGISPDPPANPSSPAVPPAAATRSGGSGPNPEG